MEQFELGFPPQTANGAANEGPFDSLSDAELAERYSKSVGINPALRGFTRDIMVAGLADPEAELERIRQMDSEEDKADIKRTYSR